MAENQPGQTQGGVFNRLNTVEKLVTIAGAVALVVQTGFTILNTNRASKIESQVRLLQAEVSGKAENREFARENAAITKEVLGELKTVQALTLPLELSNLERRVEQLSLIAAYAEVIPDQKVREKFSTAVQVLIGDTRGQISGNAAALPPELAPEIARQQARLDALSFDLQEQRTAEEREARVKADAIANPDAAETNDAKWSNYDFDIFWCDGVERSKQAKALADEIAKLKNADPAAAGQWRVRPLPALTNAKPGYKVSGFEIRVSSVDERKYANDLAKRADAMLKRNNYKETFQVRETSMKTQWYLSVFVCPR